jgi:hypothetical protein
VAITRIWEQFGSRNNNAGTSVVPTSGAISAVGDLIVLCLSRNEESGGDATLTSLPGGAIGSWTKVYDAVHSSGTNMRVQIYVGVVTTQIPAGNFTVTWTTNATVVVGWMGCFRAGETWDYFVSTLVPDDSGGDEEASGTSTYNAPPTLDPISSTGLGIMMSVQAGNNANQTPGTGWTLIRNMGLTAGWAQKVYQSFRTDATSYVANVSGLSTSGAKLMGAVHIPSGAAPATGQDVDIGLVSETDTAQALVRRKSKAAGQPSETDTAQALVRRKRRALGQVTQADSAQPLVRAKRRSLGLVSQTDLAQAIARRKAKALGQVTQADTAQPMVRRKAKALGIATETDSAQAVGKGKRLALGQALETDSAQTVTPVERVSVALGLASETDSAQPLSRR